MVGGIKASSPGMKSMSADMFLDLPTMSAPSGEERKLGAAAQVERAALYYASAAQDMHSRACGVCMPEAVGVRSLRAARERLPSAGARTCGVHRASCDHSRTDVRTLPPILKLMLNKRRPGI